MFKLVRRAKLSKDAAAGGPDEAMTHVLGPPSQGSLQGSVSDLSHLPRPRYNIDVPPAVAFASANPYLDRPLPTPPLRQPNMNERPSTSGGPGSRSKTNNGFDFGTYDKRVSRDDFYLSMRSGAGPSWKQNQRTAAPRSQPPTPEGSPRSKAPSHPVIRVVRVPTPESIDGSISGPIGMALGSPSHPPDRWPPAWSPAQGQQPDRMQLPNPVSPLSSAESMDSYDMPKEKKQAGRWKLFGRFGRRNTERTLPAVTISGPNDLNAARRADTVPRLQQPEPEAMMSRSNTTRSTARHKPIVIRSQTTPYGSSQMLDPKRGTAASQDTFTSSATHGRVGSNFGSIPIALDQGVAPGNPGTNSLLDVEIPHTTMERYSVMFSGVLGRSPSNSSSALLARRQATVRELRKISDGVIREEEERNPLRPPRRATSPQPARSPAFALFPQATTPTPIPSSSRPPPQLQIESSRPGPRLARASTSPALLPTPSKGTFALPPKLQVKVTTGSKMMTITTTSGAKPREQHREQWEQAPIQGSREVHFDPDQSALILDSPTDIDSPEVSPEIIRSNTLRHKIKEPEWEIVSSATGASRQQLRTPSSATSTATRSRRSPSLASPASSSVQTHMTKPSADSSIGSGAMLSAAALSQPMDENEMSKLTPVEASIARQISLSRQQRQMLQPLQTSFPMSPAQTMPVSGGTSATSSPSMRQRANPPVPRIAMGKNERLVETKTATPTLVVPRDNGLSSRSPLPEHRKSERIIVEG